MGKGYCFVEMVADTLSVDFGVRVCRDDAEPKPSPEPVLLACRLAGVSPKNTWVVGDYVFDIQSGSAAGCYTVYLETGRPPLPLEPDLTVRSLSELAEFLVSISG